MPKLNGGEGTMLPKPDHKAKGALGGRGMDAIAAANKIAWQSSTVKQVHQTLKKYSISPSTLALTNKTIEAHVHPQERVKEPSVSQVLLSQWKRNACEILPAWLWG